MWIKFKKKEPQIGTPCLIGEDDGPHKAATVSETEGRTPKISL